MYMTENAFFSEIFHNNFTNFIKFREPVQKGRELKCKVWFFTSRQQPYCTLHGNRIL